MSAMSLGSPVRTVQQAPGVTPTRLQASLAQLRQQMGGGAPPMGGAHPPHKRRKRAGGGSFVPSGRRGDAVACDRLRRMRGRGALRASRKSDAVGHGPSSAPRVAFPSRAALRAASLRARPRGPDTGAPGLQTHGCETRVAEIAPFDGAL